MLQGCSQLLLDMPLSPLKAPVSMCCIRVVRRSAKRHGARRMCFGDSAGKRCIDIAGHTARLMQAYMDATAATESYTIAWQRIAPTSSKPRCAMITCLRHFSDGLLPCKYQAVCPYVARMALHVPHTRRQSMTFRGCGSCRLPKWIIISTQEISAESICSGGDGAAAVCIVCDPRGAQLPSSSDALFAADEDQLTKLLAAHDADFTLCVVPADRVFKVCRSIVLTEAATCRTHFS